MNIFEHITDCQDAQEQLKTLCDDVLDTYKNDEEYNTLLKQITHLQNEFKELEEQFQNFDKEPLTF